jgi:hypothetical protein
MSEPGSDSKLRRRAILTSQPPADVARQAIEAIAPARVWADGGRLTAGGRVYLFTILPGERRKALLVEVCETRSGRVTGLTNVSAGGPACP